MVLYALMPMLLGLVAAFRLSGWRVPAWIAGLMVALFGVVSLGINAVSQWSTLWALLAILWGAMFIAVAELHGRGERELAKPVRPQISESA